MEQFDFGGEIVWWPSAELMKESRLRRFMDRHGLSTVADLIRRSTEDLEWFWNAVLEDLGVEFYKPYDKVVDLSAGRPWARWCVGGKMNIVHNCLDKRVGTPAGERVALRWEGEEGSIRSLTYSELSRDVDRLAASLRAAGVQKGDVVGIFMPMVPEIAIALFAVAKLGAIVLPLFSGYGAGAVATRLADGGAKLLVTVDGFYRRGDTVRVKEVADEAVMSAPSVKHMVVVRRLGREIPWHEGRDLWWHELLTRRDSIVPTERTGADDPLMIIYTSGTTGKPKGALHTHCSFPIKAAQDMVHGFDVSERDTLYWVTDMGWMMGPWELFGATLLGATVLFYEGALDYPAPDRLWSLVDRHGVTILGVSPTLVRALMRHGERPVANYRLSTLRMFGSTGEPWNPASWQWLFDTVGKKRLPIINYSGGTEIAGGILVGNLLTPIKPCSFSGPAPGMAADVVDEKGNSVRNQVGELVVRQPWIGMTRGFWNDRDRYLETYWSRLPDAWVHGDWAAVDQDGLWYILGRSDDTIKVAGKRVGPAEVESVLASHPRVSEAAAIGVPDEIKGEVVVCFCVLRPNTAASHALAEELKDRVAEQLGKALKPVALKFVSDLPKTRNAKIMRRVIRAIYLGKDPGDLSSLENPQATEEVRRVV